MTPLVRVIRLPSPTIMPDRIGIIGKTHGVNESNNPKPKKEIILNNRFLSFNFCVIESCSESSGSLLELSLPACKSNEAGKVIGNVFLIGG